MYIAIDIGATYLRVAIGKEKILEIIKERTKISNEELKNQIVSNIRKLVKKYNAKIESIGVSSIGPLDMKRGIIIKPANLPVRNFKIVEILEKEFKVDAYLINDAISATIAEKFYGKGKNYENLVYVTISSGIGGGAIINGKLILGKDGNALEVGHMRVDLENRLKCGCGKYGHWEAYCSGKGIPNFVRYLAKNFRDSKKSKLYLATDGFKKLEAKHVFEFARVDKFSRYVVEEIGKINSVAISNLINLFDPEIIVIGGSVALNNKEFILEPIKKHLKESVFNRIPKITFTNLKENSLLGAFLLAKNGYEILRSLE